MLKVYVIATSDQDARDRFAEVVKYCAGGDLEFQHTVPDLFVDAEDARASLESQKSLVKEREHAGTADQMNPEYVVFINAAKPFVVEVLDVLVGEV